MWAYRRQVNMLGWAMIDNIISTLLTFEMIHYTNLLRDINNDDDGSSSGREGTNESGNGLYNGQRIKLNTPKTWDPAGINEVTDDLNKQIVDKSNKTNKEWGYFLVWDNENSQLSALVLEGIDNMTWIDISSSKAPDGLQLGENEYTIGFNHAHLDGLNNYFSSGCKHMGRRRR